ncbi:hypothetical protein BS47DRAFT_1339226, partial [Hydnum rufescens UP504]
ACIARSSFSRLSSLMCQPASGSALRSASVGMSKPFHNLMESLIGRLVSFDSRMRVIHFSLYVRVEVDRWPTPTHSSYGTDAISYCSWVRVHSPRG